MCSVPLAQLLEVDQLAFCRSSVMLYLTRPRNNVNVNDVADCTGNIGSVMDYIRGIISTFQGESVS